ncbi:unnamed protein product, partial [Hapterophycus canaliculatus]
MGVFQAHRECHSSTMRASCSVAAVLVLSCQQTHAFSSSAAPTRTSGVRSSAIGAANAAGAAAPSFRPSLFFGARAVNGVVAAGALRMSASDNFDVNTALAELRQSVSSPKSQLPSSQPTLPSLPSLELPKNVNIPSATEFFNTLPKFGLPGFPELPTEAAKSSTSSLLPPQLLQPTSETWIYSRLSEAATKASESSINTASKLLPPTPEKYAQLSMQATDGVAQASLEVSNALNALVAANPSLAPAVAHLRSSLTDAVASIGEAYAAGNALIPEEYKPLAATLAIGAGATALGMSIAAASEKGRASREKKTAPLPREYDLPAIMNYYNSRPLTLLSRLAEVSYRLGSLAAKLWLDKKIGDGSGWEKNMDSRAAEFLEFVQG